MSDLQDHEVVLALVAGQLMGAMIVYGVDGRRQPIPTEAVDVAEEIITEIVGRREP